MWGTGAGPERNGEWSQRRPPGVPGCSTGKHDDRNRSERERHPGTRGRLCSCVHVVVGLVVLAPASCFCRRRGRPCWTGAPRAPRRAGWYRRPAPVRSWWSATPDAPSRSRPVPETRVITRSDGRTSTFSCTAARDERLGSDAVDWTARTVPPRRSPNVAGSRCEDCSRPTRSCSIRTSGSSSPTRSAACWCSISRCCGGPSPWGPVHHRGLRAETEVVVQGVRDGGVSVQPSTTDSTRPSTSPSGAERRTRRPSSAGRPTTAAGHSSPRPLWTVVWPWGCARSTRLRPGTTSTGCSRRSSTSVGQGRGEGQESPVLAAQLSADVRGAGTGSWNRFAQDGRLGSADPGFASDWSASGWLNRSFAEERVTVWFPFVCRAGGSSGRFQGLRVLDVVPAGGAGPENARREGSGGAKCDHL